LKIQKLAGSFGAEVSDIDLKEPLAAENLANLQAAFVEHQILIFHDQQIEPKHQLAFSEHFGPVQKLYLEEHRIPDCPEVVVLSNEQVDGKHIGVVAAGDFWHSDLSPSKTPGLATILYGRTLPSQGGDTEFADMFTAYDTLSHRMKARIANLRGVHCINKLRNHRVEVTRPGGAAYYKTQSSIPDECHPIVRTHPVSGRKGLYISPRFTISIVNMDDAEAQPLLDELFAHQIKPAHVYLHNWQVDDLVMWDNRSVNHRACGGYEMVDIRRIHRTSTLGDVPF
jgi:taurine dioxygenase